MKEKFFCFLRRFGLDKLLLKLLEKLVILLIKWLASGLESLISFLDGLHNSRNG